ncbi:MAG: starch-binding protein, partial [Eubacteriales bacterium]|nr:starch-binding protein [Eubacteriales bacterium]
AGAETGAANVLHFDATSAGWKNFKKVFCYIWEYGGESFFAWQAKASACTDTDGDGVWTYDLDAKKVTLQPGVIYGVIFSNENQMQTYDLLFDSSVIGDTAYCDGTEYENPKDSTKTGLAAFWKGQDRAKYGPVKCITSIGNVVGTCIPATTSAYDMFVSFLKETLDNARTHSGKDDQTLIDDTAKALGLGQDLIEKAIKEAGVTVDWKKAESAAPPESDPGVEDKGNGGNGGGGSGTGTKTGRETTVLFIMLGVMIAAAFVLVIARKRDRA